MKVPLSWLKEYVTITRSPRELAEMLTNAGLEVESVTYLGVEGAELVWDREKVLLGRILRVASHPDADKLVLATVDYGAENPKVVVTGAPNLRPYLDHPDMASLNLFGAIIFEGGTYLDPYKEKKPTKLKGKPLRGIYNDAMLCSQIELGLGEDHDGIMLFTPSELGGAYSAGTPLQDVLGNVVFEIAIIPNIARAASVLGVAREVAALSAESLRYPSWDVQMDGAPLGDRVQIHTEQPELNPRFVALLIENVQQKPSPFWLQRRLKLAGQRPINVVVDVSNYVMLEMGQPNHTFDYDFLRQRAELYGDGTIQLITRLPHEGEQLITLDGKTHTLFPNNILVTDPLGNLSLGGIMGGQNSEIQPATQNVLLEAAAWNFINIRHSKRQLDANTDAAFRFSRGVHPSQAVLGARRAAELLRTLAGGTVAQGIVDSYPRPLQPVTVQLDLQYAQQLSGLWLGGAEMAALLRRAEFIIETENDDFLIVTAPDHRMDIEGAHDLVEEICRLYRYENIPMTILADQLPPQRVNVGHELEERLKGLLVQLGWHEVITYRLTTALAEARATTASADDRPYVTLSNPSTADRVVMRHDLLASVLEIAVSNSRFMERIAIFEVGQIYLPQAGNVLPEEPTQLAMVLTGTRSAEFWQTTDRSFYDFFDMKGVIEAMCADLKVELRYESAEHPSFRRGRTARLWLDQTPLGWLGELHPQVVDHYEWKLDKGQGVLAALFDIAPLISAGTDSFQVAPLPTYPAVREDIALVVERGLSADSVAQAIRQAGGNLLRHVQLFDLYEGEKISADKRQLAYHLTFQSDSKTLTDEDVKKARQRILSQLERTIGAVLRQ